MQTPLYPSSSQRSLSTLSQTSVSSTITASKESNFISGVFNDFVPRNSITDKKYQTQKLKIIAFAAVFGALGGHSYASWRGFFRLKLWSRHVLSGTFIGLSLVLPFFAFRNISNKNHPVFYVSVQGAIFGSIIGVMHRGPHYIPIYSVFGIACYLGSLLAWNQIFKPVYYGHFLRWPEYRPPVWWPYQHLTAIELLDGEIERERLNVIYPEDIQYFIEQEKEVNFEQKQIQKKMEIEQIFVHESEINERKQLENPAKNWFFR